MDTDRNLLFAVLALQADLIGPERLAKGCALWAAEKARPLADVFVEQGWLTPEDRADIDRLLRRKLAKHGGDARASLAEATTDRVRQSLAAVADDGIRQSLAGAATPPTPGYVLLTTDYVPAAGERYTLSRLHATGGIGRVWLARDASLGRDVALKELRSERAGNPAVWARFLREAQVTGQLEHPGIVPIYDVGRRPEDESPFYTMRFVRGRTLAEAAAAYHARRRRGAAGPLELRELLTAFLGMCNAVAYAHSRGVLHRDLKPQNVVLGDFGEVVVLDWGLARLLGHKEEEAAPLSLEAGAEGGTVQGQVLGTPAYMPPEQAEGRLDLLDARSDVYGLGAVLYEVLTGQAPFTGQDTAAVLRRVVHDAPLPPRAAVPATPRALEAVCLKALGKRPQDRYDTAKELAAEVQRWLADEPVRAYRDPVTTRLTRWGRRHRTLATAALVLLVAGVATSAVIAVTSEAARQRTEKERQRAEKNLDDGLRAVRGHYVALSEVTLEDDTDPREVRRKQLASARDYFQRVLEQRGDDAKVRKEAADAHFRIGTISRQFGQPGEALASFGRARAAYEKLARDYPGEAEYRTRLSRCHNETARVHLDQGDFPLALKEFEKSHALREGVFREHPTDLLAGANLASAVNNLALTHLGLGDRVAARRAYQEAIRLQKRLMKDHPRDERARDDLARTYHNLGRLEFVENQFTRGLALCRKAIVLQEALVKKKPGHGPYRYGLALSHGSTGWAYQLTGKEADALEAYGKARKLQERLVRTNPGVGRYRRELANVLISIGTLYRDRKEYAPAREALEQAIQFLEELARANPEVASYRARLAAAHTNHALLEDNTREYRASLASYRRAMALQEQLVKEHPKVPDYRYDLAITYNNLGYLLHTMGQRQEGMRLYRQAGDQDRELLKTQPNNANYLGHLAVTHGNLGYAHWLVREYDEAERHYQEKLALWRQGSREQPGNVYCKTGVGSAYLDLAYLARGRRQWRIAFDWLQRSQDTLVGLVRQQPWNTRTRYTLRVAYQTKARTLDDVGRHAAAAAYWGRAAALEKGAMASLFRLCQMMSLAHRGGDHAAVFMDIDALAAAKEADGPLLYDLACYCSLAAGVERVNPEVVERYARRTMELLRQAKEVGYFGQPGKLANFKNDADLDPMRRRAEFRHFLHGLLREEKAASGR